MIPPTILNSVLDGHGGYTILTRDGNTLWKPGSTLRTSPYGTLVRYDERGFYQRNDDVTIAYYKVEGVRDLVIVWFDNATGLNVCGKEYPADLITKGRS